MYGVYSWPCFNLSYLFHLYWSWKLILFYCRRIVKVGSNQCFYKSKNKNQLSILISCRGSHSPLFGELYHELYLILMTHVIFHDVYNKINLFSHISFINHFVHLLDDIILTSREVLVTSSMAFTVKSSLTGSCSGETWYIVSPIFNFTASKFSLSEQ